MKRGSMRSPIPEDLRSFLEGDPFMKKCVITGDEHEGRIEWHHAFTYAGKRQNEIWSIIPLCQKHHKEEARLRKHIKLAMTIRAGIIHILTKYPRAILL